MMQSQNYQKVSLHLNRFMFGVVLEQLRQVDEMIIDEPYFRFRPRQINKESLRELLKYLDLNYPRDNEMKPLSYTKLSNKDMLNHIDFIVKHSVGGLQFINDEWERLISQIRD